MCADSKHEMKNLIKRLREDIFPLFEQVISDSSISFNNPDIPVCWKTLDCESTACSLHKVEADPVRCWQIAGTYCGGEPQGEFVQKYGKCSNCKVLKEAMPSIVEEIGEHFNNMVFLLNKQKQSMTEKRRQIEHLNQELISALEQLDTKNRQIQELMITDNLTGLYNRHHLADVLEDEIARCHRYGHPLAMMMLDIDGFKSFNDTYGHLAGDSMLSFAGALIKENIRKFDKAFRYGGEEFVVVLPETDITLAYIVAERIRKGLAKKSFIVIRNGGSAEEKASRTFSIGLTATFPYSTDVVSIDQLIQHTDTALYQAKEKGGNIGVRYE